MLIFRDARERVLRRLLSLLCALATIAVPLVLRAADNPLRPDAVDMVAPAPGPAIADADDPFAGQAELSLTPLVEQVLARNPSLQAAAAAWQAAAERYPQEISLDDPMFGFMVATRNVGYNDGQSGYLFEASQAIPWPGKRALRGEIAAAEADAAGHAVVDAQLRLAEGTQTAYFDYYLARRETEVNEATTTLTNQLCEIAKTRYESGQATEQDVLQAEVELAELATAAAGLTRDQRIAKARINTLLHRRADHPIPPPPARLPIAESLPDSTTLEAQAVRCRPDLAADLARIAAEESRIALACKEYYPDMRLVARYDGTMIDEQMRPMLGMDMNVPLQKSRRAAAVREAAFKLEQRRADYQNRIAEIRFDVDSALARVDAARRTVRLYEQRAIPAAEQNIETARSNYISGRLDFLRLIEASRQLHVQRQRYHQATADYLRRHAELQRSVGCPISEAAEQ